MAHDVFISYSNKDKAVADAICSRLENEGVRCWYAPRDIAPGADWAGSIIDSIEESRILVLVFTDFSNASRQVLREVNNAVRTGAVIVPFRLTASAPSGGMRYYLSAVHWLDAMNEPLEESIRQLSEVVHSILDGNPAPPAHTDLTGQPDRTQMQPETVSSPATGGGGKKWLLPVCLALLAVLCGMFFLIRRGNPGSDVLPPSETTEPEVTASESTAAPAPAETDVPAVSSAPAETDVPETSSAPAEATVPAETEEPDESAEAAGDAELPEPNPDNYLYKAYSQTVTLSRYFGTEDTVVVIPPLIEGLPVTTVGKNCFENHTEITRIILPDTVSTIESNAFYGCTALKEINFPPVLRKIDGWAFAYDALTSVTLPDSLKTLGYGAFYSNLRLESVFLPEQVKDIGENTFQTCPALRRVTILAPDPEIHLEAFEHDSKVTIIGIPGGYSEKYARATGLAFEAYSG